MPATSSGSYSRTAAACVRRALLTPASLAASRWLLSETDRNLADVSAIWPLLICRAAAASTCTRLGRDPRTASAGDAAPRRSAGRTLAPSRWLYRTWPGSADRRLPPPARGPADPGPVDPPPSDRCGQAPAALRR